MNGWRPPHTVAPTALLLICVGAVPACFLFENCDLDGDDDCSSLTKPTNRPPSVTITSPVTFDGHSEDSSILLEALVSDPEDRGATMSARMVWSSDRDGRLGTLNPLHTSLSAGIHVITATYADSGGLSASDSRRIAVLPASYGGLNRPPIPTITLPAVSPVYAPGAPIVFEGEAVDPEEGPLPNASIHWEILYVGVLGAGRRTAVGTGRRVTISTPAPGDYYVYLVATDLYEATGETSRSGRESMLVGPFAPCQVEPPSLTPGTLSVVADDTRTVAVALAGPGTAWARVRLEDGTDAVDEVVADHSFQPLTESDWLLTLEPAVVVTPGSAYELEIVAHYGQTDPVFECRAPLSIEIDDGASGQAPLVFISSPTEGAFYPGESITFAASGVDPEDGPLTGSSLVWEDSSLGVIGTGESFTRNDLPNGVRSFTVTATDSDGNEGSAYVTASISPNLKPEATIVSPSAGQSFRARWLPHGRVAGVDDYPRWRDRYG